MCPYIYKMCVCTCVASCEHVYVYKVCVCVVCVHVCCVLWTCVCIQGLCVVCVCIAHWMQWRMAVKLTATNWWWLLLVASQIEPMRMKTIITSLEIQRYMYTMLYTAWTINKPHLPYKTRLDVMQSHLLHRTRFGQYQASSAVLGWPGDGDCHIMHRMQSGGWPYSKVGRESSKAPSLHAAVLRAAVFCSKILRSDCNRWSSHVRVIGA